MIAVLLRNQLILGPPLLSAPVKMFAGLDKTAAIYRLARRFAPAAVPHLLSTSPTGAAARFVKEFSRTHFPLDWKAEPWNADSQIEKLARGIPALSRVWENRNYEYQWSSRVGDVLAIAVLQKPPGCNGSRVVALQNAVRGLNLPHKDAAKIPASGWSLAMVVERTAEQWPGFADRCRWLYRRTGNIWLDGWTKAPRWTKADVDALTQGWEPCLKMEKVMRDFDEKMAPLFAAEIINHIAGGKS